eukprot:CAMPEP_0113666386 /NCGR_PEP_ID=MMETSP0038_2-20120614/2844_1 /TAXON_ID=2898 /ORGANISM="Cryptomonas paramecium" /LENGTH=175 /DNA_ID=CAMNT_0000581869 /DNA_START=27 /DNA_END=554 /DNA_ORIENTATION=- /assembly_acc=CAM_ASM_000170
MTKIGPLKVQSTQAASNSNSRPNSSEKTASRRLTHDYKQKERSETQATILQFMDHVSNDTKPFLHTKTPEPNNVNESRNGSRSAPQLNLTCGTKQAASPKTKQSEIKMKPSVMKSVFPSNYYPRAEPVKPLLYSEVKTFLQQWNWLDGDISWSEEGKGILKVSLAHFVHLNNIVR